MFMLPLLFGGGFYISAESGNDPLVTVTVQFEMNDEMVSSREAYAAAVEDAMEMAMKEGPADLVIFPEYIGVFAALIPWSSYLVPDKPFEEVWMSIAGSVGIRSIRELFILESAENETFLNNLWGNLARKYETTIISGSRFVYDLYTGGLYNQAVVYGSDGEVLYRQNKHFLTDFETDIVGLDSGDFNEITGFEVNGKLIRLTICRDTFLKKWEHKFNIGELWIDIKANGVEYTPDQVELFTRALPSRLAGTEVPYGITACLTGEFLNLLWEGESNILYNDNGSIRYEGRSRSVESFEILRHSFP